MAAIFVLPNSLFEQNDLIAANPAAIVYIIEHPVFFTMYPYHKLKLVLHRASMKYYAYYIAKKYGNKVVYVDYAKYPALRIPRGVQIYMYDPVDHHAIGETARFSPQIVDTPLFLCGRAEIAKYKPDATNFRHVDFYKYMRQTRGVLMKKDGTPRGGKYSFDTENRAIFPRSYRDPYQLRKYNCKYLTEARAYIERNFAENPGEIITYLPITHAETRAYFRAFVARRLQQFGKYQDAVRSDILVGNHSGLAALMNIGLITPQYVVDALRNSTAPLASLEGYLRQVIGWREYSRLVYVRLGARLRRSNIFNARRKVPHEWYGDNVRTGFEFLDIMLQKVHKYAYLHHIERLMYIGNYLLLCGYNPSSIAAWYQSIFIDSYHVFMDSNVLGMSQWCAGPLMMTRPYFSSAAYIRRMANLSGGEWIAVWNALYYSFIARNATVLQKNYYTAAQVRNWQRKTAAEKAKIHKIAAAYNS